MMKNTISDEEEDVEVGVEVGGKMDGMVCRILDESRNRC